MNEEPKSKVEGWRKMGIAMGSITALAVSTVDFKTAVLICIIALYGITWHGVIDYGRRPPKNVG